MPTPRYLHAMVEAEGRLYAIGGYWNGYRNTVEEYNPGLTGYILFKN